MNIFAREENNMLGYKCLFVSTKTYTHYFSNIYIMFTFLYNMKLPLQASFLGTWGGGEKLTTAVDANKDGLLGMEDFKAHDLKTQEAIKRVLGQTNMATLERGSKLAIKDLIEHGFVVERNAIQAESRNERASSDLWNKNIKKERLSHSAELSQNQLQSAVNWISRKMTQAQISNEAQRFGVAANPEDLAHAIAAFQAKNGLGVDGKIWRNTSAKITELWLAAKASSKESKTSIQETQESTEKLTWPVQNGTEQARQMQALIGTHVDGVFGPNSRKQLQVFLKEKWLYTGAIDGIVGNGTADAMRAFNRGVAASTPSRKERASWSSRNLFDRIGDFVKRGGERPTNLAWIDKYIDARNTELNALAEQITNAKQSRNPSQIASTHTATLAALHGKIPNEMYTILAGATNPVEQTRVLDYISNALMGGRNTVEIAQGRETARKYAGELRRLRARTAEILGKEGMSSQFISQSNAQIENAMNRISQGAKFSAWYVNFDSAFSVRSKGSNQQLEGFSKWTTEALKIDGMQEWEINETMEDKMRFIENMNLAQLQDIDRQLKQVHGLTVEKFQELVKSWEVEINMTMFIAHNCGNVSYAMDIKDNMKAPEKERGERDRGEKPDKPTTNPGEDATTSPWEDGRWSNDDSKEVSDNNSEWAKWWTESKSNPDGF